MMEKIQISKIKPYDNNAKKHSNKQIKQIAESIKRFGFGQCIVLDKDFNVVIGHGRLLAAKELGWKTARIGIARAKKGEEFVPAVLADDLTEEEIIAYRLADNKLNESAWDMDLAIEDLKLLDEDLISLTGFSIDLTLEPEERDDEVPEIPEEPKSKIGDIYKLGNHRLFCGDATNPDHIKKLMQNKKADMVFTDPPYNVNYSGRGKNTKNKILNDNMAEEEFEEFLTKTFQSYKEAAAEKTPFYICHSSSSQSIFERAMAKTDLLVKNQIIWNKTIASMGWGDYRWVDSILKCNRDIMKDNF